MGKANAFVDQTLTVQIKAIRASIIKGSFIKLVQRAALQKRRNGDAFKAVDSAENSLFFDQLAPTWWDEEGPYKLLHQMNRARLAFIREVISEAFPPPVSPDRPLVGRSVLDIGCGGGLLSEPLCRLGADVVGLDASRRSIEVARAHAEAMGLSIHYTTQDLKDYAAQHPHRFDVVIASEVIEHVGPSLEDVGVFIGHCQALLAPGGRLILSTLNRTWQAYLLAIVGAEYLLKWAPRGTHQWRQFKRPSELANFLQPVHMAIEKMAGLRYNPLTSTWMLSEDYSVNYIVSCCLVPQSTGLKNFNPHARSLPSKKGQL